MPLLLWLSLLVSLVLLVLLPFLYGEIMLGGLGRLYISKEAAVALMFAIAAGSFINLPLRRIIHQHEFVVHPLAAFGLARRLPRLQRIRRETVIAVNVGGCLIPVALVLYELTHLAAAGSGALAIAIVISAVNAAVCYVAARPVAEIGIVMPGLLSPLVAAGLAMLFVHDQAAPVAFVAGVLGPLIGADLLHLRDFGGNAAGMLSIGGAGTFDGIVLSGIVAAYLA